MAISKESLFFLPTAENEFQCFLPRERIKRWLLHDEIDSVFLKENARAIAAQLVEELDGADKEKRRFLAS